MNSDDLKKMGKRAGEAASAEAVYLFGSQARGSAGEESDFDLALILEDANDPWGALMRAQRALWPREVSIDLAPISKRAWMDSQDSFIRTVRREGRLLYSRDG